MTECNVVSWTGSSKKAKQRSTTVKQIASGRIDAKISTNGKKGTKICGFS